MSKLLFITVYIGKWPWYFPYFLHSCKHNSSIEFYIFSDNKSSPYPTPENVKIIPYSIGEFKNNASQKLGYEVAVNHGYKICDFKPAFGFLFEEYIAGYDFWGYCDIDIIFGNVRKFMTPELLNNYDAISARHDYLTGSFALFKNNSQTINLFRQSKDHKRVFTEPRNLCFDETNYAFDAFLQGIPYKYIKSEIESMTHVVRRLEEEGKIKPYFEFQIVEGFAGNLLWEEGNLIYRKEYEAMYYHLVRMKRKYSERIEDNTVMPYKFRIGKKKFYGKKYRKT